MLKLAALLVTGIAMSAIAGCGSSDAGNSSQTTNSAAAGRPESLAERIADCADGEVLNRNTVQAGPVTVRIYPSERKARADASDLYDWVGHEQVGRTVVLWWRDKDAVLHDAAIDCAAKAQPPTDAS